MPMLISEYYTGLDHGDIRRCKYQLATPTESLYHLLPEVIKLWSNWIVGNILIIISYVSLYVYSRRGVDVDLLESFQSQIVKHPAYRW